MMEGIIYWCLPLCGIPNEAKHLGIQEDSTGKIRLN